MSGHVLSERQRVVLERLAGMEVQQGLWNSHGWGWDHQLAGMPAQTKEALERLGYIATERVEVVVEATAVRLTDDGRAALDALLAQPPLTAHIEWEDDDPDRCLFVCQCGWRSPFGTVFHRARGWGDDHRIAAHRGAPPWPSGYFGPGPARALFPDGEESTDA